MASGNRVYYFDLLRIVSILAVVVLHIAGACWGNTNYASGAWKAMNLYDSAVRWCVPVFVMISGALFLNPDKTVEPRKLFCRNILRIVVVYFVWSAAYVVFDYFAYGSMDAFTIIKKLITGHYHMWFLLMLLGLYVIIVPLRKITASKSATRYFVILCLVFSFAIPTIHAFVSNILAFDKSMASVTSVFGFFSDAYAKMSYNFTLNYVAYFVLGWYLHSKPISGRWRPLVYALGIISIVGTYCLTEYASILQGKACQAFYGNMSVATALESVAVFTLAQSGERYFASIKRALSAVSADCFGIYLVHAMLIEFLNCNFGLNALTFNSYLSIPVLALAIFLASMLVAAVLRRIPVIGKYIC